jgi:3-hydroxyethyl bacteriochlorophyllide a dehydrogenase
MGHASTAVVFESPGNLSVRQVTLPEIDAADCLVEVTHSGISTGTERLLYNGSMPPFPGLRYPLVPGYESIGYVLEAGPNAQFQPGQAVFIPGSRGFTDVAGLFGGAAKHLIVPSARLIPLPDTPGESSVLLALAATAVHAVRRCGADRAPDLVIGNGVLGRLIARCTKALYGNTVTLWEASPERQQTDGNPVFTHATDARNDYQLIIDVSGDHQIIDQAVAHMTQGATLVLAGFYHSALHFDFAPAFMREITIKIAAEWHRDDITTAAELIAESKLFIDDLVTHRYPATEAASAYREAFTNPDCLKTILDWSVL